MPPADRRRAQVALPAIESSANEPVFLQKDPVTLAPQVKLYIDSADIGILVFIAGAFQPLNTNLTAVATAGSFAADKMVYWTGASTATSTSLTSFARTLIDDTNAAAARTTLELGGGITDEFSFIDGASGEHLVSIVNGIITGWVHP